MPKYDCANCERLNGTAVTTSSYPCGLSACLFVAKERSESDTYSRGWICPKCGRVLSPYTSECPCYFEHIKPTCLGGQNDD